MKLLSYIHRKVLSPMACWIEKIAMPNMPCDHRFEIKDVMSIETDPLCHYCKKPLSELTKTM